MVAALPPMDWPTFVQLCVNGLTLGSVYALLALGYSMVYGVLKLLNFAHGDVFMIGAFIGYGILTSFGGSLDLSIAVWLVTEKAASNADACGTRPCRCWPLPSPFRISTSSTY